MSEESYQEIHAQNISRGQLIEEHERKIEAMEIQLKSTREQYEHQLKTLVDTKKEVERIGVLHLIFLAYDRNFLMIQKNALLRQNLT
jgi:hypothetical protein